MDAQMDGYIIHHVKKMNSIAWKQQQSHVMLLGQSFLAYYSCSAPKSSIAEQNTEGDFCFINPLSGIPASHGLYKAQIIIPETSEHLLWGSIRHLKHALIDTFVYPRIWRVTAEQPSSSQASFSFFMWLRNTIVQFKPEWLYTPCRKWKR